MKKLALSFFTVVLVLANSTLTYSQAGNTTLSSETNEVNATEAEYPGGDDALAQFRKENIVYPIEVKASKEKVQVIMGYTIDQAGNVKDVVVLKSSGFENFDKEAIRVYNLMPNWKPATENGVAVSTDFYDWIEYIPEQE